MPYELKVDGMAEISATLEKLEQDAPKVAARALYEGAGVMRTELEKAAEGIKTEKFQGKVPEGKTRLPSPEEKAVVQRGAIGIAKFAKNGTEVDTSVGFSKAGYTKMAGKTVPIALIANSINSGTSFMQKQPFFRKGKTSGGKKALNVMERAIEKMFEDKIKNGGK